jgi:hypothetical protein
VSDHAITSSELAFSHSLDPLWSLRFANSTLKSKRPTAHVRGILARLDEFKANVRRIDNRAVFEVPEILAGILETGERPAPWSPAPLGPAPAEFKATR